MGALIGLCPQCGYSPNTQKTSEFPFPRQIPDISPFSPLNVKLYSPKGAESQLLRQEIFRIDDAIHQLYEQRASLCRKLNELQSFTANLPTDILTTVFHYVCPPSLYNSSHHRVRRPNGAKSLILPIFALSAVSSRWRQIVISSPRFWSKLDWHWKYHLSPEDTTALLRTYFIRALPLSLDLKLTIDEKWEIENTIPYLNAHHVDGHLEALKQTIFCENSARVASFSLDAPIRWLTLLSKSFLDLSDLSLRSGRIDECIDLSHLPSLTHLTFTSIKVTPLLPWKQISTIHLVCAHVNVAFDLLTRCPHLRSFHNHHPNPVRNSPTITKAATLQKQITQKQITLPHLRWLDWCCVGSTWDESLFRFVHLPKLKRLNLSGDISWGIDSERTLASFLRRLPPIVLELGCIRDCAGDSLPVLKTIFRTLGSSLRDLTIVEDDHWFLEKLLILLTPSASSASHPDQRIYLPSLRILSLHSPTSRELSSDSGDHHHHHHHHHGHSVFTRLRGAPPQSPAIVDGDLIVQFLEQRRKVLLASKFCLDWNLSCPGGYGSTSGAASHGWSMKCRENCRKMVQDGFDLVIKEGGREVEWLLKPY